MIGFFVEYPVLYIMGVLELQPPVFSSVAQQLSFPSLETSHSGAPLLIELVPVHHPSLSKS